MSTNPSALWSSLFMLDVIASSPLKYEPPKVSKRERKTLERRYGKLTPSLALIGAKFWPQATVTAYALEVSMSPIKKSTEVILRVAQDRVTNEEGRLRLQHVADELVKEISGRDKKVWLAKGDRCVAIRTIVHRLLLPRVIEQCGAEFRDYFKDSYSRPFRAWHAALRDSDLLQGVRMDDLQKKTLLDASRCVHIFANGRYFNPKDDRDIRAMVNSVASSYIILHSFDYSLKNLHKPFLDNSLEKFCQCEHPGEQIKTGPPSAAMDGATKDYRPWNPTEYERRAVSRLLRRLGKYYAASCTLVSELVDIVRRTGCGLCIQVQALPFQLSMDIMRTPKVENEYSSVDDFFRRCVTAGMWDLDFKKLEGFCNTWVKQWSSEVLYLHVEMQFALFYALNPDLSPKRNYIGMCGKKCCFCCDFVIRYLRETEGKYNEECTGYPLFFSTRRTNGRKYRSWIFPDPLRHLQLKLPDQVLAPDYLTKLCNRFRLIRKDLEEALVLQVRRVVRTCSENRHQ